MDLGHGYGNGNVDCYGNIDHDGDCSTPRPRFTKREGVKMEGEREKEQRRKCMLLCVVRVV
jgi:hypothetical protein